MAGSYYEVQVRPDASGWSASLAGQIDPVTRQIAENLKRQLQQAVRDGLNGTGVNTRVQGTRAGEQYGDAFSRALKARIEAGVRALPKIKLDANSSDVDREIAEIRRKLAAAGRAIDLGVDDKVVLARVEELRLRLANLARNNPDIRVRVNTGTALAELETLKRSLGGFDRKSPFKRMIADLRQTSPAIDAVIGKLGNFGDAASKAFGNPIVLIGTIIALLSTVGPLIAAATAAAIGLAGVAGVAALAFVGLRQQASQGTGVGFYIASELQTVKNQFRGLGQVAAQAIGPAIQDLLSVVQRVIPTLEPLVASVGGKLGGAARSFGTAILTALQKSAPLISEVAGYVEQGAAAFARWVASPSFENFLTYARRQLPVIIGYAKDFGAALIDTFKALAPLGEAVLGVLDLVAKGISAVSKVKISNPAAPGDVDPSKLVKVRPGETAADAVKRVQAAAAEAAGVDNLAASYGAALAPLDKFAKATGDLGPALIHAKGSGDLLAVSVNQVDQRLRAATPALAAYLAAVQQYDAGTATVADTAGLLGAAFTASRGNALDYAAAIVGADTATQGLAKTLHDNLGSIGADGKLLGISYVDDAGKFVDASNKYSEGSSAIVSGFQSQVKAATDAATATYTNELATRGQATAANDALVVYKGYRQSLIDSAVAAGTAKDKAQALADQYFAIPPDVDTFVKLLGQNDVSLAIQGLTDALNRLSDFIGAPQVVLNDEATPQAQRVQSALSDLAAQRPTPTASLNTAPLTANAAAATSTIDVLNGSVAAPSVTLRNFASAALAQIQGQLTSLQDRTITITTIQRLVQQNATAKQADISGSLNAYGNVYDSVPAYAYGGIIDKLRASMPSFARGTENHIPQIARPGGPFRIWAEPETQGEAYIPFAMDRRARAEDILANVAQRFGGAYTPATATSAALLPAASSGRPGGGLLGMQVTIDAGSVGTLTGHVTAVADSRIASSDASKRVAGIGPGARGYGGG